MFDRVGERSAELTGALSLPGWILVVLAAFVAVVGVLAFVRGWDDGRSRQAVQVVVVLILALIGGWVLNYSAGRDLAAERRALDARGFDLATRALAPGSALACLDTIAGEAVENACEKALFASPEATAAAVSYVAAQLSLLAAGSDHSRSGGADNTLMQATLRRAVETDRFGIVAHVLATRGGCTPNHCSALALLQDTTRVKANLVQRPFEARVRKHMDGWAPAGSPAVASSPAVTGGPAVAGSRAAGGGGARRRGEAAGRQSLLPIVGLDPARQYHDRRARRPAGGRHDRGSRARGSNAAQAAAGRLAGAPAAERRQHGGPAGAAAAYTGRTVSRSVRGEPPHL